MPDQANKFLVPDVEPLKVDILQEELKKALDYVAPAVQRISTMPIMTCFTMTSMETGTEPDSVLIAGSNFEISIQRANSGL
ncbi:unnamed protein product, partial [marine sediment metagenome]